MCVVNTLARSKGEIKKMLTPEKVAARTETDAIADTWHYNLSRWSRVCRGGSMAVITIIDMQTGKAGYVESRKGLLAVEKKAQQYMLSLPSIR
jgi:hypothetical protein